MSVEKIVDDLLEIDHNVGGVAIISKDGVLEYQTENWDLSNEANNILEIVENGGSSITLLGIKYMIVENTPERIIGTNISGNGHIILAPFQDGVLITYIIPEVGPRDVLFNVQSSAQKLNGMI